MGGGGHESLSPAAAAHLPSSPPSSPDHNAAFFPHDTFKCNICLCTASDPVVTVCGHLFCWPCLYTWLHFHSKLQECPVCKGAASESRLIPIYNTSCATSPAHATAPSATDVKKNGGGGGGGDDSTATTPPNVIPPRPKARRIEIRRQSPSAGRYQQLVQFTPANYLSTAPASQRRRHHRADPLSPPTILPLNTAATTAMSSHRQMIDALLPVANLLSGAADVGVMDSNAAALLGVGGAEGTSDGCEVDIHHHMHTMFINNGNETAAAANYGRIGGDGGMSSSSSSRRSMVDYYVMVGRETRAAWMERLRAMREERLAWPVAFVQGITSRELLQQRRQAAAAQPSSSSNPDSSSISSSSSISTPPRASIADHLNLSPRASVSSSLLPPTALLRQSINSSGGCPMLVAADNLVVHSRILNPQLDHGNANHPAAICSNSRSSATDGQPRQGGTTQRRRRSSSNHLDSHDVSSAARHAAQYLSTMSSILSSMEVFARALQLSATSASGLASTSERRVPPAGAPQMQLRHNNRANTSHVVLVHGGGGGEMVGGSPADGRTSAQQLRSEQERFWQSAVRGLLAKMERLMRQLQAMEPAENTARSGGRGEKKDRRGGAAAAGLRGGGIGGANGGRPESNNE